jgi:membrane-bound lytic murein transglycosylase D
MDRVKEIPEEDRASWRFHVVKDGETLEDIATAMHTHASEIANVNEIAAGDPPKAGDALVIPMTTKAEQQRYKARHGDTLVTVADRFGVSVEDLRAWNHLSSNRLSPGRTLYVAEPVRLAPATRTRSSRSRSTAARGHVRATSGKGKPSAVHAKSRSSETQHKKRSAGR